MSGLYFYKWLFGSVRGRKLFGAFVKRAPKAVPTTEGDY